MEQPRGRSPDPTPRSYLFSYNFDGSRWNFEVPAKDEADARARVARMVYATCDGEVIAKLPVRLGPLARASVFFRNVLFR